MCGSEGAGAVEGDRSCLRLLNGKPEPELCNGLYVNTLHIISSTMFVCVPVYIRVRKDNLTSDCP